MRPHNLVDDNQLRQVLGGRWTGRFAYREPVGPEPRKDDFFTPAELMAALSPSPARVSNLLRESR